ncbi:LPS translocon maturation chaperone LptM [Lampropedia cohaerens]|nr:lipoprotein [Lampropedia cohaerens]
MAFSLLAAGCALAGLTACGQSGPLYLPDGPTAQHPPVTTTVDVPPAP